MNKDIKLYNVLFPLWMLMMFPVTWFIVIPGNFLIDSLVLIISLKIFKIEKIKEWWKKYILKIFLFGMLSDIIGSILMLGMVFLGLGRMADELYITLPGLIIASIMIYIFNYYVTFRNVEKGLRFKLALTFAIATAPYTFLFPSSLLYGY